VSSTSRLEQKSRYRADIDGLRGLAVLAVVLFHGKAPGFSGGYIGVDVFFVISGYLITLLLAPSVEEPIRGWLSEFYIRRGRRILPALFVSSMVTTAAAIALLLPWDLAHFGQYLAATSVLATNVLEWHDRIGYFRSTATHSVLAHLWSITVEEQFYLLFPLTLMVLVRHLASRCTRTLLALMALSFGLCVWASYYRVNANYFLAPFRAWQLLLGAVLATGAARGFKSRTVNELLGISALITLATVIWLYGPTTRYPGLNAVAPCTAAAVLIVSGNQHATWASKLLSLRPLVFTGLISYSLYLWHFPILILIGYYQIRPLGSYPLDAMTLGLGLAFIYGIAILSWKIVERPIRSRTVLRSDRWFVLGAIASSLMMLGVGLAFMRTDGLPGRFPRDVQARGPFLPGDNLAPCIALPFERIALGALCSYGPTADDVPRAVVWGDSHALMLMPDYARLAVEHHMRIYFAASPACQPLLGFADRKANGAPDHCTEFNSAMVAAVRRLNPQLLILNARWIGVDSDHESDRVFAIGRPRFERGLEKTLHDTAAATRSVCVVEDAPAYQYDLPHAVGIARRRRVSEDFLHLSRAEALAQYQESEQVFRLLEQRQALKTVDLKNLLCRGDRCVFESGHQLLYMDQNHLSLSGAQFVASVLEGCFRDLPSKDTNE
jgi:peptidoglycan/LPS O-acetylase OafA/YrhL